MAGKADGDKLQGLICPMCLDVFKNATILTCGHTFCKGCLEAYDEKHYDRDHITCPVCRLNTKLGRDRVAGLTPNFSLKGLEDELNVDFTSFTSDVADRSSEFCSLHKKDHKTIFCEVCEEFICISCFIDHHQGHKIIKKEELECKLNKTTNELYRKCKERKIKIEKSVDIGNHYKQVMNSHFDKMGREVRDVFAKKFSVLQENEEVLLGVIDVHRRESVEEIDRWISERTRLISSMNNSIAVLKGTGNARKHVTAVMLKKQILKCSELTDILTVALDEDSACHIKDRVESMQFCGADEKLLDLGCIDIGAKVESRNIPSVSNPENVRRESEQEQEQGNENTVAADIPPVIKNGSLKIVRKVQLKHDICGMAALSEDAVVLGYGGLRKGSDCVFVSGYKKPHLKNSVGHVNGIVLLTDGSPVVAHTKNSFSVYNPQGTHQVRTRKCKSGDTFLMVCRDQSNNVYAVNCNPEIYVFQEGKQQRSVATGGIEPNQICVTKAGDVMITTTCNNIPSTVTVYDREGLKGTSFAADNDSYVSYYAALDSQDRVLVARVREWTDEFRMTRYTLLGRELIKEMIVRRFLLPDTINGSCCHMVSLTPNLLAFANGDLLFFMEIAD